MEGKKRHHGQFRKAVHKEKCLVTELKETLNQSWATHSVISKPGPLCCSTHKAEIHPEGIQGLKVLSQWGSAWENRKVSLHCGSICIWLVKKLLWVFPYSNEGASLVAQMKRICLQCQRPWAEKIPWRRGNLSVAMCAIYWVRFVNRCLELDIHYRLTTYIRLQVLDQTYLWVSSPCLGNPWPLSWT